MTKKIVGISLDTILLSKLDKVRGLIPRSRYLEKIIGDRLADNDD